MHERVIQHLELVARVVFDESGEQLRREGRNEEAKLQETAAREFRAAAAVLKGDGVEGEEAP